MRVTFCPLCNFRLVWCAEEIEGYDYDFASMHLMRYHCNCGLDFSAWLHVQKLKDGRRQEAWFSPGVYGYNVDDASAIVKKHFDLIMKQCDKPPIRKPGRPIKIIVMEQ